MKGPWRRQRKSILLAGYERTRERIPALPSARGTSSLQGSWQWWGLGQPCEATDVPAQRGLCESEHMEQTKRKPPRGTEVVAANLRLPADPYWPEDSALTFFASRDFFRDAAFFEIIPRCALLSSTDSAERSSATALSRSPWLTATSAFLICVRIRDLAAWLRAYLFSLCRRSFMAAGELGTNKLLFMLGELQAHVRTSVFFGVRHESPRRAKITPLCPCQAWGIISRRLTPRNPLPRPSEL